MSISKQGQAPSREVPAVLGRYEIVELLSAGGMGEVFVARTVGPGGFIKPVAVKRIREHLTGDPEFVAMLHDEARIAACVKHPNIVAVIDVGSEGEDHFIVTDFVSGEHVGRIARILRSRGQTMPPWMAAFIGAQVAAALHAVHDARALDGTSLDIIHRDVSPGNIMLSDAGHALLFDFGVAKASQRLHQTSHGEIKGKLPYMAPETFAGVAPDRSVDIFGLGVVMYEMLTGVSPFARTSDIETIAALKMAEVFPPSQLVPQIDSELERIVQRAMTRERPDRYNAAGLERALRNWAVSTGAPHDAGSIAAWLETTFPERIAARRELLARVATGKARAPRPETPAPRTADGATVAIDAPTQLTPTVAGVARYTTSARMSEADLTGSTRPRPVALVAGAVLLATVALVVLAVVGMTRMAGPAGAQAASDGPAEAPTTEATSSASAPQEKPNTEETSGEEPVEAVAPAESAASSTAALPPAPRPRRTGKPTPPPGSAAPQPGKGGPLVREWD